MTKLTYICPRFGTREIFHNHVKCFSILNGFVGFVFLRSEEIVEKKKFEGFQTKSASKVFISLKI